MQNGLDHEAHEAPVGARLATPDETVIDNWTHEQLTDFCDRNGIDYPVSASRDDLMDAIEASGVDYPFATVTAEAITEPGEVAKQLLLAQMALIVHASEKAHTTTREAIDPAPLYRVICSLSESMATCVNAYAALEQSLQKTSTTGLLERVAEKVLPMLGA
jgi:hypothetical protein